MKHEHMKKGFTLIELLVSVLIIVVLTGSILVVVNPSQIRGRARDSQRVADLKAIQSALENYYLRNRAYPSSNTALTWVVTSFDHVNGTSDSLSAALLAESLISPVPTDPEGDGSTNSNPCLTIANNRYNYLAPGRSGDTSNADEYILTAIMESVAANDDHECTLLDNWDKDATFCPTFETSDYCYGVESR